MTSVQNSEKLSDAATLAARLARVSAPMGRRRPAEESSGSAPAEPLLYARGEGSYVWSMDGRRYVDLAAGFGSLLLGHGALPVREALSAQACQLMQALGDLYASERKLQLLERLSSLASPLHPTQSMQGILGLSGADALTAAIKTAMLFTGRSALVALQGAYHGLSFAPLALCDLRTSYRTPFEPALPPLVTFVPVPRLDDEVGPSLQALAQALAARPAAALVMEPVLGRAGCIVPHPSFVSRARELCRAHGTLLVADEVWTGLGRSGAWLYSVQQQSGADIVCLGKGLGGGVPISACLAPAEIMSAWAGGEEVVHTSTFAGAPLACAAALATLDTLEEEGLVARACDLGTWFRSELERLPGLKGLVSGTGMMLALQMAAPGRARSLVARLLARGFIVSSGGGRRDSVVLTPALNIERSLIEQFLETLDICLKEESP